MWGYAWDAWLDRPLVGHGFGRFRSSVQSQFSVDFVRSHAADDLTQAWFDPHNVVVGVFVAVGAVGFFLFAAWAVVWGRRVRGPFAWALLVVAAHWLLQPVSLVTLPVAALLFGAATPADARVALSRPVGRTATTVGIVLGASLLLGDAALQWSVDRTDADAAEAAAFVFWRDPVVSDVVAQVHRLDEDSSRPADGELRWHRRAVSAEPDRPYWWVVQALAEVNSGDIEAAERSVHEALRLQPTNVRAWRVEAIIAIERVDLARLTAAFDQLCELGQPECGIDPTALLEPSSG